MKTKAQRIQKAARFFFKPHTLTSCSPVPPSPAVILLRHSDLQGPIRAFLSLNPPPHLWVLDPFFQRRTCYEQYRCYTFAERRGKRPKRVSLKAALAAFFVVPLVGAIGAVPVYRGKRDIGKTLDASVNLLKEGETLAIAVDKDYRNKDAPVSSIYTGFFQLEHRYFDATGEHLPFYALRFNDDRTMTFSPPLSFSGSRPFPKERKDLAKAVVQFLNNETGS